VSDNHRHIKNLPEWKAARAECFERDDHQCQCPGCNLHDGWCGATEKLQADHTTPLDVLFADGVTPEAIALACDVDGLLTMCGSCNGSKGASTDVVTIRHTWVNPRYAETLGWLDGSDATQDDTPSPAVL
jgi:5-methylcytosine-specific restriction endonuclease McrA